jgi:2,3-bisphosphoglycerate-dependent phosphoglycerate mutase
MTLPNRIVLVRHAQSLLNLIKGDARFLPSEKAKEILKRTPDHLIELTPKGIDMAKQTGKALKKHYGVFDAVYDSGYRRAVQTRVCILKAYAPYERKKMRVFSTPLIREREGGYIYNMTQTDSETAFPWLQEYWDATGPLFARPPGGESIADVYVRAYMFLDMLTQSFCDKSVLVITHGRFITAFRACLENWNHEQIEQCLVSNRPSNCSITTYEKTNSGTLHISRAQENVF